MLLVSVEFEVEIKHVTVVEYLEAEPLVHVAGDGDASSEHGEGLGHAAGTISHDGVVLHGDGLDQVLALFWLALLREPDDALEVVLVVIIGQFP
jgi:hypothetical protein